MEYVYFFVGLMILAVIWGWRVRRGGSGDDRPSGLHGDVGESDLGYTSGYGIKQEPINARIPRQGRVSRESGHGKDGGG